MFMTDFKASRDLPEGAIQGSVQPANLMALMDPEQLQQVVWNLCQNALKYGKGEDKQANLARAEQLVGDAKSQDASFVALPEMFNGLGRFATIVENAEPIVTEVSYEIEDRKSEPVSLSRILPQARLDTPPGCFHAVVHRDVSGDR